METTIHSQKLSLLMKPVVPVLTLHGVLSVGCLLATAQASSSTGEIEQLKSIVGQQQRALEQQQAQIVALQSALAEQKQILVNLVQGETSGAMLVPAEERKAANDLQVHSASSPIPAGQQSLTPRTAVAHSRTGAGRS
jgi:hypothetical protein